MQIVSSRYFLFFLSFLFPLLALAEKIDKPADFRLIVTGGIKGIHGGDSAFYESPLFRLSDVADALLGPYVIENANFMAFRCNDVLYFSFEKFDKSTLQQSEAAQRSLMKKGAVQGLLGAQALGFAFDQAGMIEQLNNNALRRELASIYGQFNWELHQIGSARVFAIDISGKNGAIVWPASLVEIDDVEAVIGLYPQVNKRTIFFPRSLAPTSRVFGVVDHLLAQSSQVPTRYLDLGNALLSNVDESLAAAKQTHQLLMTRNPVVLGASRYDLSVLFQDQTLLDKSPYVIALKGFSGAQQSRIENLGNIKVQFSALGDIDNRATGFFPKGVSSLTVSESIQSSVASASNADLVIGISDNSNSAGLAISSPVFDAVLSLVSDVKGALPAQDDIDLERNHQEGLHSVAPLVRVSALDVTEILFWTDKKGYINRLEIHRYPIVDSGPEAKDAEEILNFNESHRAKKLQGLPIKKTNGIKQAWIQTDLDDMLGGILLRAQPNTELAIIEKNSSATPIYSAIGEKQAQNLLDRPGRAIWLSLKGKYLKRVLKASQKNQFGLAIVLIGGDSKKDTIGLREIEDNESYRVVVTEKVFFALDQFMQREGLFAKSHIAASSLQTSLFEGSRDSLKMLSELRKRDSSEDVSLGEKLNLLGDSLTVSEIVRAALICGITTEEADKLMKDAPGKRRYTLVFDISDLDFGLKFNHTNDTLLGWQKDAQNSRTSFTEARFWDPNYLNMLIYAKAALKYYGPWVDGELAFSEKFFRGNSLSKDDENELNTLKNSGWLPADEIKIWKFADKLRPMKDTTKITAELRLPFNKVNNRPFLPALGLGAFSNVTYETQIWPNIWMNPAPSQYWPQRVNDGRFILGLSARPKAILDMIQVGGVFGYDFSRSSPIQSLAAGFEVGAAGKWNIGALVLKLESSVRKMFPFAAPEKGRIGLIWLTDSKVEVPIYGGFSLSALLNFTVGAQMDNPWSLGSNTLFGLALSYGGNFKWLL